MRCKKKKPVLCDFQVVTVGKLQELQLCDTCTKWSLYKLFNGPDGLMLFNRIYGDVLLVNQKINPMPVAAQSLETV
jgi:hypothetical protein